MHVLDLQTFLTWMQMLRPQRDCNPKCVGSRVDALSVRLWGLLRAFPSLFSLQRSIHCSKTGMVAVNASLNCKVALDATCRLTLSIFHFISYDGFVNAFLPFRSTFGIFFLTMHLKVTITEGFEPPKFWFEVRSFIRQGMLPDDVFPNSFFLHSVTWVRNKVALGACYCLTVSIFFFCMAGYISFANHD